MRGSKFPADMHNIIWCPIYIPSYMIIGSVVSEELRWQDFGTDGQTDRRTDRVTALLDLLSPLATQVKIYANCFYFSTVSSFLHIMIRHNVDFCKNESRFMPLIIFHLNCILLLIMKMNKKPFLFHSWEIRAEGQIPLTGNALL